MSKIPRCELCGWLFRIDNADDETLLRRRQGMIVCPRCESALDDADKQKLFSEVEWAVRFSEVDPDLIEFYEQDLQDFVEKHMAKHDPKVRLRFVAKKGVSDATTQANRKTGNETQADNESKAR